MIILYLFLTLIQKLARLTVETDDRISKPRKPIIGTIAVSLVQNLIWQCLMIKLTHDHQFSRLIVCLINGYLGWLPSDTQSDSLMIKLIVDYGDLYRIIYLTYYLNQYSFWTRSIAGLVITIIELIGVGVIYLIRHQIDPRKFVGIIQSIYYHKPMSRHPISKLNLVQEIYDQ